MSQISRRAMLSTIAAVPVVALTTQAKAGSIPVFDFLGARCSSEDGSEVTDCAFAPDQDLHPPTYEDFNEFPGRWAFHSHRTRDEATLKYRLDVLDRPNGLGRLRRALNIAFGPTENWAAIDFLARAEYRLYDGDHEHSWSHYLSRSWGGYSRSLAEIETTILTEIEAAADKRGPKWWGSVRLVRHELFVDPCGCSGCIRTP